MTPRMERALGSFQHRVARQITGRQPKRQEGGIWEYSPLDIVIEEAGFKEMGAYVLKRHNTVAQYIATRPILELFKEMVWRHGEWVASR